MFSKSRLQTFTYYYGFAHAERWRDDFAGLRARGFQYIILNKGLDLKNLLASREQTNRLKELIDTAEEAGIQSILHIGNPRELYLLPDNRQWRLDYVKHVAEVFRVCKGLYGLQLEAAPTGGSQFAADRWHSVLESVEGRLSTMDLTEDGYRYGRRTWQMEQYALFTAELVKTVKKVKSSLKTTVGFHLDSLLPAQTLVHFQNTARALDFVVIDPGILPFHAMRNVERVIRWAAAMAGTLTDRDIWMVVDSQAAGGRCHTTLRELREWTRAACSTGVSAVGWHGWDDTAWHEDRSIRGRPLSESNPEQWETVVALSQSVVEMDRTGEKPPGHRCLLSYDSFVNRLPWLDVMTPHRVLEDCTGRRLGYVSDSQIAEGDRLSECDLLFCTPSPAVKDKLVEQLIAYMRRGGWIVGSADDFTLDEGLRHCAARSVLFGIRRESVLNDPDRILLSAGWPHLKEGTVLSAFQYRIRTSEYDEDVRVIGRWGDGSAAVILKPHGKGGALYMGTEPYQSAERESGGDWRGFLGDVLNRDTLNRLLADPA